MLDKQSPVPIYYQLEEIIKNKIENRMLQPDEMIPSEREYAERFEVSRMTVRQAITNLVNNGYLYRLKGKGTFVQKQKIEQRLQGLTSFSEEMVMRGLTPSTKLLEYDIIFAGVELASKLAIQQNEEVYKLKRLRLADNIPMALETAHFSKKLFPNLTEQIARGSIYDYAENECHLNIDYATQEIEATVADGYESEALQLSKDSPTLTIYRLCYLDSGTPLEYVKTVFRADRYKFIADVKRR